MVDPNPDIKQLIRTVGKRLQQNLRVRRMLPGFGRIHIDRQLPFICVYRRPTGRVSTGTDRLATTEASYMMCSAKRSIQQSISDLISTVVAILAQHFGACLLLEFWEMPSAASAIADNVGMAPQFRIVADKNRSSEALTATLQKELLRITVRGRKATVECEEAAKSSPKYMRPILPAETAARLNCYQYGLQISPIYRNPETNDIYPDVLTKMRRGLTLSLRRVFFEFTQTCTTHQPPHYHALGRRAVVQAVWEVDRILTEASNQFDFLLQVSPVNGETAWRQFKGSGFQKEPTFIYRPLPAETVILKRNVFRAPLEKVEDPALAQLFRSKMVELDRRITMMLDLNTPRFLHGSIQLYGGVEDELLNLAKGVLDAAQPRKENTPAGRRLRAASVLQRAKAEIAYLTSQSEHINPRVEIRKDISGLMVSRGCLLVGAEVSIDASRIDALLQHEIGIHLLTYFNGRMQPFRQLYSGLAGYDALQEGLAVLAEYFSNGLKAERLRQLAASVVAVEALVGGANLVDTHRLLTRGHGFSDKAAFHITSRVYRGGGFTKDAVYLRGLARLLRHVKNNGEFDQLLIGKLAFEHIPIIRELMWRGVLKAPALKPRFMGTPDWVNKMALLRQGIEISELIRGSVE